MNNTNEKTEEEKFDEFQDKFSKDIMAFCDKYLENYEDLRLCGLAHQLTQTVCAIMFVSYGGKEGATKIIELVLELYKQHED